MNPYRTPLKLGRPHFSLQVDHKSEADPAALVAQFASKALGRTIGGDVPPERCTELFERWATGIMNAGRLDLQVCATRQELALLPAVADLLHDFAGHLPRRDDERLVLLPQCIHQMSDVEGLSEAVASLADRVQLAPPPESVREISLDGARDCIVDLRLDSPPRRNALLVIASDTSRVRIGGEARTDWTRQEHSGLWQLNVGAPQGGKTQPLASGELSAGSGAPPTRPLRGLRFHFSPKASAARGEDRAAPRKPPTRGLAIHPAPTVAEPARAAAAESQQAAAEPEQAAADRKTEARIDDEKGNVDAPRQADSPAAIRQRYFGKLLDGWRRGIEHNQGKLDLCGCFDSESLQFFSDNVDALLQGQKVSSVRLPDWVWDAAPVAAALKKIGARVIVATPADDKPALVLTQLHPLAVHIEPDPARRTPLQVFITRAESWDGFHGGLRLQMEQGQRYFVIPGNVSDASPAPDTLDQVLEELVAGARPLMEHADGPALLKAMFRQTVLSAAVDDTATVINMKDGKPGRKISGYSKHGLVLDLRKFSSDEVERSGLNNEQVARLFRELAKKCTNGNELNGVRCASYINKVAPGVGHLLANAETQAFLEVSPPPEGSMELDCLALGARVQIQIRDCANRRTDFVLRVPAGAQVVPLGAFARDDGIFLIAQGDAGLPQVTKVFWHLVPNMLRFPNGLFAALPVADGKSASGDSSMRLPALDTKQYRAPRVSPRRESAESDRKRSASDPAVFEPEVPEIQLAAAKPSAAGLPPGSAEPPPIDPD